MVGGAASYAFKILLPVASAKFNKETYRLVSRDIIGSGVWNCAFIIIIGGTSVLRNEVPRTDWLAGWLPGCLRNGGLETGGKRRERGALEGGVRKSSGWKGVKERKQRKEKKTDDEKAGGEKEEKRRNERDASESTYSISLQREWIRCIYLRIRIASPGKWLALAYRMLLRQNAVSRQRNIKAVPLNPFNSLYFHRNIFASIKYVYFSNRGISVSHRIASHRADEFPRDSPVIFPLIRFLARRSLFRNNK